MLSGKPTERIGNFGNNGKPELWTISARLPGSRIIDIFSATEPITDRITLYQYDALNRVVTTTLNYAQSVLGTDLNRISATAYDPVSGRVAGTRDTLGRWVGEQYDLLGRVTTTIANCRVGSVAQPSGCDAFSSCYPDRNVPTRTGYDALGRTMVVTDALGVATRTGYDTLGRVLATRRNAVAGAPTSAITNVTTLSAYDGLDHTTVLTDAIGASTHTAYNGLGQTVAVTDTLGRVTRFGYDGNGTLRWSKRNDGQLTLYLLDGLGRAIASIVNYQDGSVVVSEPADQDLITRTSYDAAGRTLQTTNPAGRVTQFTYDNQDRLVVVTENAVSTSCPSAPRNVVTQYQYDRAGNRIAIVDARGYERQFVYDAANQPIQMTDALGRTTTWSYDAGGRRITQHDQRGSTFDLAFGYDELDRPTQSAASSLGTISAHYDALGRRQRLLDATGITTFTYDVLGRITQVQAPQSGTIGYGYDAAGRRTQLTYPDGTTLRYGYLADGQLHLVTSTTTLATYSYDAVGRFQTLTRANGTATSASYDGADRLTDLHTQVGSTTRSRFQYTLDRAGLRSAASETLSSATRTISYTYDGLLRLTDATETPGTHYAYAYDDVGNRTGVWLNGTRTLTQTFNAANQVEGWSYDAAGNLTNDGTTSYTYDAMGRLTQRGSTSYSYNGDGVLISDGTTRYTQDLAVPLSQVLAATDDVTTTDYLYGIERLAALRGGTRIWYGSDALGSVRQTLSDTGTPLSSVSYDPWGVVESGTVPTFGFTSEVQDSAGMVYLRTRWYHAGHGTFTGYRWRTDESLDREPYTHHPYAYALSNPLLYIDPAGTCPVYDEGDDCHKPHSVPRARGSGGGGGGSWDDSSSEAGGVITPPPPGIGVDGPPVPNPFPNVPAPRPMTMPEIPPAVPAVPAVAAGVESGAAGAGAAAEILAGGPPAWIIAVLGFCASILGGDAPVDRTQPQPVTPQPTPNVPTPTPDNLRPAMLVQLQEQRGPGSRNTVHHETVRLFDKSGGGVTTAQAIAALEKIRSNPAIPGNNRIQQQADDALQRAKNWVNTRPPGGVSEQNRSWSFYFDPQKRNNTPRFDIVNITGTNLRR